MIRVTMFFSVEGAGYPFGFSETHWFVTGTTRAAAREPAKALYQKRLDMCARNIRGYAIRISKDGIRGDADVILPPEIATEPGGGAPGKLGGGFASEQPNVCLLLRAVSAADATNQRRGKALYLAGLPDEVSRTDPPGPEFAGVPGLKKRFADYKALLKNGFWGFLGRALNVVQHQVVGYNQEGGQTGRLGVQVAAAIAGVIAGTQLQIRGSTALNPALPGANGIWQVHNVLDPGGGLPVTYYLTNSEGVDADNVDFFGKVEVVTYSYHAYEDVVIKGQTTRKRGVGGWRRAGKSSRRQP